ncbi:MAG: EamA family transporter [Peptococcaceae bacterium]|jgi:drug/metabolite transporter (DMT)-like permease|nr:EamA family transporter [Peptococcaceae bacterium]
MFLWNWGFSRLPASFASLFFFVQPLTGTILGHFFLGEPITGRFLAGGLLIAAGVLGAGLNLPGREGAASARSPGA